MFLQVGSVQNTSEAAVTLHMILLIYLDRCGFTSDTS